MPGLATDCSTLPVFLRDQLVGKKYRGGADAVVFLLGKIQPGVTQDKSTDCHPEWSKVVAVAISVASESRVCGFVYWVVFLSASTFLSKNVIQHTHKVHPGWRTVPPPYVFFCLPNNTTTNSCKSNFCQSLVLSSGNLDRLLRYQE